MLTMVNTPASQSKGFSLSSSSLRSSCCLVSDISSTRRGTDIAVWGTGFFVAPQWIVTARCNVSNMADSGRLEVWYRGTRLKAEVPHKYSGPGYESSFLFLRLENPIDGVSPLPLADSLDLGEAQLGYYWLPAYSLDRTRWATRWFSFWRQERVSVERDGLSYHLEYEETPGIFGGPLVNRDGQVSGMVISRYNENKPIVSVVHAPSIKKAWAMI